MHSKSSEAQGDRQAHATMTQKAALHFVSDAAMMECRQAAPSLVEQCRRSFCAIWQHFAMEKYLTRNMEVLILGMHLLLTGILGNRKYTRPSLCGKGEDKYHQPHRLDFKGSPLSHSVPVGVDTRGSRPEDGCFSSRNVARACKPFYFPLSCSTTLEFLEINTRGGRGVRPACHQVSSLSLNCSCAVVALSRAFNHRFFFFFRRHWSVL